MFGNNRDQLRQMWADAWHKFMHQQPLQPLEQQLVDVLQWHPEYHALLTHTQADYLPELGQSNPFLHMGMHLALREQVSTNRPAGIRECYHKLKQRLGDEHETEHQLMECLAEALWQAQRDNVAPDESRYLRCLQQRAQIL
ncbi:MAG: DUF1841 family protein [Gammaproteobacteria bacterium]|jgi:hypothetical protein|nr:DUF1841 family protein [Gammaproteobacteria bacterium]